MQPCKTHRYFLGIRRARDWKWAYIEEVYSLRYRFVSIAQAWNSILKSELYCVQISVLGRYHIATSLISQYFQEVMIYEEDLTQWSETATVEMKIVS